MVYKPPPPTPVICLHCGRVACLNPHWPPFCGIKCQERYKEVGPLPPEEHAMNYKADLPRAEKVLEELRQRGKNRGE